MSTERNQSQIAEVRDQLSLDYSDGRYLDNVTANLGLKRPVFGFNDDTWRAVVKSLGLSFKQIFSKFFDVLEVIIGPRVTVYANLSEDVELGATKFTVHDSSLLPQVGTLILDEGKIPEETLRYSFIDRGTNTVYLETPTTFAHSQVAADVEGPLLFAASAGDTTVQIHPSDARKITLLPATAVIGRGTPSEEVAVILSVDVDQGVVTFATPLVNDHEAVYPAPIQNELAQPYQACAEFLVLSDSSKFPAQGYVLLSSSSNSFTATGGTTTTVTYASGDLAAERHAGYLAVFDGNITPALAGETGFIESNTATEITFRNTLTASPAAGDTFSIRPILKYTRNLVDDNSLQLSRDISDLSFIVGTEVELLNSSATLALASVKVAGTGWDVIQSNPRLIEILIPAEIRDINDLRSASYLHPAAQGPITTTLGANSLVDDTSLTLADASSFPPFGTLVVDAGGLDEERVGYARRRLIDTYDAAGSTSTTLNVTTGGFSAGAYVGATLFIGNELFDINTSREITANTSSSFTFTDPLTSAEIEALLDGSTEIWVYSNTVVDIVNQGMALPHTSGDSVDYYEVVVSSTLQSGDVWTDADVFPGPYVYDLSQFAPNANASVTTSTSLLAGPTKVVVDTDVSRTAVEVEDATAFPLGSVSPYQAVIGDKTGNREVVTINEVNLKQRVSGTVDVAGSSIGDTFLPLVSLVGGGTADDFPVANGYRVLIDRGGANEEVAFVSGVTNSPSDGLTTSSLVKDHVSGESVELLADVLTVDPLDDFHLGSISSAQRTVRWPGRPSVSLTANASVGDFTLAVTSSLGLPDTGRIRIDSEEYDFSKSSPTSLRILDNSGVRTAHTSGDIVYLLTSNKNAETVEVLYDTITLASTTGFPSAGGSVFLNFGSNQLGAESEVDTAITATDTVITLTDSSAFPTTYPYEVVVDVGAGEREERVLVTNNDGVQDLTVSAMRFNHDTGVKVAFYAGTQQRLTYSSVSGSDLVFNAPFTLSTTHSPGESVVQSSQLSSSSPNGYDFPLRMPTDLLFRIEFLFDLIRAAGVQVAIIEQR